jgi:hypothetical protein
MDEKNATISVDPAPVLTIKPTLKYEVFECPNGHRFAMPVGHNCNALYVSWTDEKGEACHDDSSPAFCVRCWLNDLRDRYRATKVGEFTRP